MLIKSISGIRGTIGGKTDENLTPLDIVKFTAAFGQIIKENLVSKPKIVIGRDARISGEMLRNLVVGSLQGLGIDVIDLGLTTTPTVEIAVTLEKANAGIILTASHNPKQWNALKLLNEKGEFISDEVGKRVLEIAAKSDYTFAQVDDLGTYTVNDTYLKKHIDLILELPYVNKNKVAARNFKVVVDAVNSVGGIYIPALLKAMGAEVIELYCQPNGQFPHNPEPLPEHLTEISKLVKEHKADLGVVVDPDVDRLAFVCEDGSMFGEEYTLVAVADYVLRINSGNTVSNLSSTRALRDITEKHGQQYFAAAVGEVNVVHQMKKVNAIIGGEGNGGVILPELHYGRDALVGLAIFLTLLADENKKVSELRNTYPNYYISKNKIELHQGIDVDWILNKVADNYKDFEVNNIDGVKISFERDWVHLRKSNTEPIIRIYSESNSKENADNLAQKLIQEITELIA